MTRKKKSKNVSQKINNGTILQTRDEFLFGAKGYAKSDTPKNSYYRKAVVIDSNRKDELAMVKMTTKNNTLPKGSTSTFVYTKDHKGKPIKASGKFIVTKNSIGEKEANQRKRNAINDKRTKRKNLSLLQKLKGRNKNDGN